MDYPLALIATKDLIDELVRRERVMICHVGYMERAERVDPDPALRMRLNMAAELMRGQQIVWTRDPSPRKPYIEFGASLRCLVPNNLGNWNPDAEARS